MSGYVRPALISAIAESIGISDLSGEAARVLAPDVEYRVRDILQEATKFSRHGCRRCLECSDINHALQARDMEQLYGLNSDDRRRYSHIAGASDAFQIQDTLFRCQDMIHQKLPPPPLEVGVSLHWLLVNGIKPKIPENAVPATLIKWHQEKIRQANAPDISKDAATAVLPALPPAADAVAMADGVLMAVGTTSAPATVAALDRTGAPAVLMPVLKHSITEELSELLRICSEVLLDPAEEVGAAHPVFGTLAADAGLEPAVPYIVAMIVQGARESPQDLARLWRLLWAAHAILCNPGNNAAAYLSQLLPALLTLLLNNCLGPPGGTDHFRLRRQAASVLREVTDRFSQPALNVRARIAVTCMKALRRQQPRLCTRYGALKGLHAMGGRTLRLLLLPELADIHNALLPCLSQVAVDKQSALQLAEAGHCLAALSEAACAACKQGVTEVTDAGLSSAMLARIAGIGGEGRHGQKQIAQTRHSAASMIDARIKELEEQAQQALREGRNLQAQRLQQVQTLQRVEDTAKASLDQGDSSRMSQRRSSGGISGVGDAADPAAAARAAARMAAERFDPSRAGGTALGDAESSRGASAPGSEAGGDAEAMESPPGSPMFIPPPPKSPVAATVASNTSSLAGPTKLLPVQQQLSQAHLVQPHLAQAQIQMPQPLAPHQHPPGALIAPRPAAAALNSVHAAASRAPDALQHSATAGSGATAAGAGISATAPTASVPIPAVEQNVSQNGAHLSEHIAAQMPHKQPSRDASASHQIIESENGARHTGQEIGKEVPPGTTGSRGRAVARNGTVAWDKDDARVHASGHRCIADLTGAWCTKHNEGSRKAADANLRWALQEGRALGVQVAAVSELYGEAVLPWLALDRIGGVFL